MKIKWKNVPRYFFPARLLECCKSMFRLVDIHHDGMKIDGGCK